jgi:NAD(P)-dependent dehydrogenase (short-subunit alcohol dehydrogenase family)
VGRAVAIALHEAGAAVWASARLRESIDALERDGLQLLELDVRDAKQSIAAVEAADPVDVLVNNAGYGVEGAIEEIDDESLRDQYETNLFGPWRLIRAVLPGMRARGRGAIVNVSSFGAHAPYPGWGAYRSSKHALEGLGWTLHFEVAHFGIRVLNVEPGLIASGFSARATRGGFMEDGNAYAPMHEAAARAYAHMSPVGLAPETVAARIVDELERDSGPVHVRVGEDAQRMIGLVRRDESAYERYLVDELGFDWHPRGGSE